MYERELSISLTDDELEIIYEAICEIIDTKYYGLGFEITLKSLKDKLEDAKVVFINESKK